MLSLLILFMFLLMMSLLLIMLNLFISKKKLSNREKLSPFECGFDPMSNSRMPFSIQFFMVSLIFLIFDIELSMIIPITYMFNYMNKYMIMSCMFFFMILTIASYIEYMEKSMDWKF